MNNLWPSKKQWHTWSLPSKLTAISAFLSILAFLTTIIGQTLSISPFTNTAYSKELPNKIDIKKIVTLCAAGYVQEVKGNLGSVLEKWEKQSIVDGEARISNLGGIIHEIKDDGIRAGVFSVYISCVKDVLPQFLNSEKNTSQYSFGDNSYNINNAKNVTITH
jgi:hypothetical protein